MATTRRDEVDEQYKDIVGKSVERSTEEASVGNCTVQFHGPRHGEQHHELVDQEETRAGVQFGGRCRQGSLVAMLVDRLTDLLKLESSRTMTFADDIVFCTESTKTFPLGCITN